MILKKLLKGSLAVLLSGTLMASGMALGVSAAQDEEDASWVESSQNASSGNTVFIANTQQTIPNGRYIFYNVGTKTVMSGTISGSNGSYGSSEALPTGHFDEVAVDPNVDIPQSSYFNISNQGNGYYSIQNVANGRYLDIDRYGIMAYRDYQCSLLFTPCSADGVMTFNISKPVGDKTYSMSMYSDTWYTVHEQNKGARGQAMAFFRAEENSDVADVTRQAQELLSKDDKNVMTLASGVTADQVRSLYARASGKTISKATRSYLDRAMSIVDGSATAYKYESFVPEREGSRQKYAEEVMTDWFFTERQPTGLWTTPGDLISVYVEADPSDPLPQLMVTQHISDCHEEMVYDLKRGYNLIYSPSVHPDFSTYKIPTVEPGGLLYILNPYTEQEQSSKIKVHIMGCDKVPTFTKGQNVRSFLKYIEEYYSHYKNNESGYHNCVEMYSYFSYMTVTLTRFIEAYVTEGLDPNETMSDWDDFIVELMEFDGISPQQYQKMRLGVKVNQPYAGAYATPEMICIQDNEWLASFMCGRYGWGFPHEVGHTLDGRNRTIVEATNNMWSTHYVLTHHQYDSICVAKTKPVFDEKLVAPPDQNSFWSDDYNNAKYYLGLYTFFDLEVYDRGFWGRLDNIYRAGTTGNSTADSYVSTCNMKERLAVYSSVAMGFDLRYYFSKYGYVQNPSSSYNSAMDALGLQRKEPKIWYYDVYSYNRSMGSNIGKGDVTVTSYDSRYNSSTVHFSIPESCVDNHLGYEIVRDGRVIDFVWSDFYQVPDANATYTVNAYDTKLQQYSSATFNPNSNSNNTVASVNGTPYNDLKSAIEAAPSGGTVVLHGSCGIGQTITVNKPVTITSADTSKRMTITNVTMNGVVFDITAGGSLTVSADGSGKELIVFDNKHTYDSDHNYSDSPFFKVTGGTLTLGKGVTVRKCASDCATGCVIQATSSNINLKGCVIEFNKDRYYGKGTIYLASGTTLTCSDNTVLQASQSHDGSAIYSAAADNKIILSDTTIRDNCCKIQDGVTVNVAQGSIDVRSGTKIENNFDAYFSVSNAIFVGPSATATFSGRLDITDNVTVCKAVQIDPSTSGTLSIRADKSCTAPGFVLATPTTGSFTDKISGVIDYKNSKYVAAVNSGNITVSEFLPLTGSASISTSKVDVGTTVKITAKTSGGTSPFNYVLETSINGSSYVLSQTNNTGAFTYTPDVCGEFSFRLTITDGEGQKVVRNLSLIVVDPVPDLINNSTISASSADPGKPVRITFAASGGKPGYAYSVHYTNSAGKTLQAKAFDTSKSFDLELTIPGKYTVLVRVKDTRGTVTEKKFSVQVNNPPLQNKSTLSAYTLIKGQSIKVNCVAYGGTAPYTYAVYYKSSTASSYVVAQDFSANNTVTIQPKYAKSYEVLIKVRDKTGKMVNRTLKLNVKPPVVKIINNSKLSASAITLGSTVKITGAASGGTTPYQYAFYFKKGSATKYSRLRAYGKTNTYTFKPLSAASYSIKVYVKDKAGNVSSKVLSLTVKASLSNTSKLSASSVTIGKTVKISGSAKGGTAPYTYAFFFKKGNAASYTKLRDYNKTTYYNFKPQSASKYTILVKVKDKTGKVVSKTLLLQVREKLTNTSRLSSTSIIVGNKITITGSAKGGVSPYSYAFYYKKSTAENYTLLRGYSKTNTCTFTPKAVSAYRILVNVKDSRGVVVSKVLTLTLKNKLTNTSKLSASSVNLGGSVKITGSATGGTSPYRYAYYFKKGTATTYTRLKDYSTASVYTFKPVSAAKYTLLVKAKDSRGSVAAKTLTLTVSKKLANTSKISASKITLGNTVKITGSASGGTAPYRYAFYFKKGTAKSYTKLKDYSTTNTYTFKPLSAAKYTILVKVKDKRGAVYNKLLTLTVTQPLTNKSTISSSSIKLGQQVTIKTATVGGTSPYQYQVLYKLSTEKSYTKLCEYKTTTGVVFKPKAAGKYNVLVKVKDKKSAIDSKLFTLTVTK